MYPLINEGADCLCSCWRLMILQNRAVLCLPRRPTEDVPLSTRTCVQFVRFVFLRVCDVFPSAASSLCLQVHNVSFSFELMQDGGLERPKPRPEGRMFIQHMCFWTFASLYTAVCGDTPGSTSFCHFLAAVINHLLLAKDQIAYNDIQADKDPSSLELGLRTFAMSLWLWPK